MMDQIVPLVERLTGQDVPFPEAKPRLQNHNPFSEGGMGYSQLNELLLTLGYDRVLPPFFDYLFDGEPTVTSHERLAAGVEKFRKHAMLLYGNIKFAFKTLSAYSAETLQEILRRFDPISPNVYASRPKPVHDIKSIAAEDAYLLGYLVERELEEKLSNEPENAELLATKRRMEEIRRIGRENHDAYLTYDHMDVYIATSMRERHEFFLVSGFMKQLFGHPEIRLLKLRWFDPTQAYCQDRIDKGLVEGLMVKRAKCTIYHVQESDTLGKDSELAATLAQGKPVIAYVPRLVDRDSFKREALALGRFLYADRPVEEVVKGLLPRYHPGGAWTDPLVQDWVIGRRSFDLDVAFDLLFDKAQAMYDQRARTLIESHPLGLQVNLDTGVANGVLVVRTVDKCAQLLRKILLNTLEFNIEEVNIEGRLTLLLKERLSGCIFRVVTGDKLLTNSFWDFYLEEAEKPLLNAGQRLRRWQE